MYIGLQRLYSTQMFAPFNVCAVHKSYMRTQMVWLGEYEGVFFLGHAQFSRHVTGCQRIVAGDHNNLTKQQHQQMHTARCTKSRSILRALERRHNLAGLSP